MGVLDKFLDIMKLNDDYDDDYDDDYLEDDYDDEPQPRKSSFFNKKDKYNDDDYDDYDDEPVSSPKNTYSKYGSSNKYSSVAKHSASNNKVTPMRPSNQAKSHGDGMGVCVIKPTSVEDGREICETLLDNRTVILNLEGLDLEIAQRIIDFTSGAAYAMKGNLQKISNFIFLVTPLNVDISGDLQDLLGNSFDVSSIRSSRY